MGKRPQAKAPLSCKEQAAKLHKRANEIKTKGMRIQIEQILKERTDLVPGTQARRSAPPFEPHQPVMGQSCAVGQGFGLPEGCDDTPGFAELPSFSPLLSVGNQYAAAHGDFDAVVSTVPPLDASGVEDKGLSTHEIHFNDEGGSEDDTGAAFAKQRIAEGAATIARLLAEGKRTLVHCAYGQNRSCAICCAYAVLYGGWEAEAAIVYARERVFKDRRYHGMNPMHNAVFNEIVAELAASRKPSERGQTVKRPAGAVKMWRPQTQPPQRPAVKVGAYIAAPAPRRG